MDAIDIETVERNGQSYRIALYPDADAANPLEEWCEMGRILSLNRRHINYDPAGIEAAIADPDAVALSYYEHGLCLWSVAGELPAGAQCPFDSVGFAGLWLPDAETLVTARPYGGWTRRQFMRIRAQQACDVYTQWCNGEVYGYEIERVTACDLCSAEREVCVDSCWGIYGLEECRAEARSILAGASEAA